MNDNYVAAIDQGTTGTRCIVFDAKGSIVAQSYRKHEQFYPEAGWVEHDAEEIWEKTQIVVRESLDDAGINAGRLEAIGVTNQRETTVLWDRETGEPVHNAIVWQDRRTTERIEELEEAGKTDTIREKTGLNPDAYFSASKLEWLLDNIPDARQRAERGELAFGTIDAWLIYNLTGNHITDVTNASRTMLYNVHDLEWDEELLQEFNVPRNVLPEVRPSVDEKYYGSTDVGGDLVEEVPVAGALGDQQAALFGQACFGKGEAKNTYGTGSFFLLNTGQEAVTSNHGLLTTIGFQVSGEPVKYALEGSIFVTGAAIEWLEDVELIGDADESEEYARRVESTDGVYFVPAFAGLGAPFWNQRARGTIIGLTRGTRKGHIVRAALESIAYQTRDVAEAMAQDSELDVSTLKVDGGAVKNDFLCEFQAGILDADIILPVVGETTALGAAYAAGLATGYWEDFEELRSIRSVDTTFSPSMDRENADKRYRQWREAVERSLDWA